jgi:hypothetical protein
MSWAHAKRCPLRSAEKPIGGSISDVPVGGRFAERVSASDRDA